MDQHKTSYVFGPEQASKMERLFLANSFDLIELLVRFHLAHLYPQLRGCKLVKELEATQNLAHDKQVKSWQEQRARRIAKVIDEYNDKGWFLRDNLDSLKEPLEMESSDYARFQGDYCEERISAKDIVLPPFLNEVEERVSSFTIIQASPDGNRSLEIEEELPLEGIPFVDEAKKTPQIGKKTEQKVFTTIEAVKSNPASSTGSSPGSSSTA